MGGCNTCCVTTDDTVTAVGFGTAARGEAAGIEAGPVTRACLGALETAVFPESKDFLLAETGLFTACFGDETT